MDSKYKYGDFKTRLKTYAHWRGKTNAVTMARAGFFYIGVQDITECFFCGVMIYKWNYHDSPYGEHEKFSPSCIYIKTLLKELNS